MTVFISVVLPTLLRHFLLARIADGSLRWDSSIGSAKMRDFLYKQSYISGIFSYLAVTFHKVQLFVVQFIFSLRNQVRKILIPKPST